MIRVEKPLSKNMERVAYHDLNGQPGFQMALQVVDGRYYLYVTTYYHQGWQILDVTDMDNIICKHLDDPRKIRHSASKNPDCRWHHDYSLRSACSFPSDGGC